MKTIRKRESYRTIVIIVLIALVVVIFTFFAYNFEINRKTIALINHIQENVYNYSPEEAMYFVESQLLDFAVFIKKAGVIIEIILFATFAACISIAIYSGRKRAKHLATLNTQANYMFEGVKGIFDTFIFVDLIEKSYIFLMDTVPDNYEIPFEGPFDILKEHIVNNRVPEKDKKAMNAYLDIDYIYNYFSDNDIKLSNMRHRLIDDEKKWVNSRIVCLERVDGKPTKVIIMRQDVTLEVAQERMIKDALNQALEANNSKSNFLANMSHDIRTPMNAIIGFNNMAMKHFDDKEKVAECLEKISISSAGLLSLINDILDMSKIESGNQHVDANPCDVVEEVKRTELVVRPQTDAKGIEFVVEYDIKHTKVIADKILVNRVIGNLLSNAIKFTETGGKITFRISEKADIKDGYALYELSVKDTGIGMSEEFIDTIFDTFTRERTSTVSGITGTGLGMAISKNLVDLMGGTISVKSKKGVGSEFKVALPTQLILEDDSKETEEIVLEPYNKKGLSKSGKESPMILVVEDNELNREIICDILKTEGFSIEEAFNGLEAVQILEASKKGYFDCVLMDVQMPIMDGYEATKTIRASNNEYVNKIPIIAMTANAFDEDKRKALECGMNMHISKPIKVDELLETLYEYT
ncbi:MAG: response regulator [Lachnospiraceae bacterium]|nr:response regulator [Lachnospiraceae bacterium]